MKSSPSGPVSKIFRFLYIVEDTILSGLLILMILIAVTQIALRNLFDGGLLWGDELVRILVLWIGLAGAMIASRTNHHISIDVISRYLPKPAKAIAGLVTYLFTAIVCTLMTFYSIRFVLFEKQDGILILGQVPAWLCESIIPFAFAVIALRYLAHFFSTLAGIFKVSAK